MEQLAADTQKQIELYCKMESHRPFTVNHAAYCSLTASYRDDFRERRNRMENNLTPPHPVAPSRMLNRTNVTRSISATVTVPASPPLPPSRADGDELELASQVLAYHHISSKRISDVVPMIFQTVFTHGFSEVVGEILVSKLKLLGEGGLDTCVKYAQDEPNIDAVRKKYSRDLENLSEASKILNSFFNSK